MDFSLLKDIVLYYIVAFLPVASVLITVLVVALILVPILRRRWRVARVLKRGAIGMARIVAISQTGATFNRVPEMRLVLDIERVGEAPRRVTITQFIDIGAMPRIGERVYVMIDPGDPAVVALSPQSMRGPPLPATTNRLDPLVLAPQLLRQGAKASGVVSSATPEPLADGAQKKGFSRWRLALEVRPENGSPYQAELVVMLTSPEKAARIAYPGAQVPLRYDPADRQMVSIDSIAMGYGDPSEAVRLMQSDVHHMR